MNRPLSLDETVDRIMGVMEVAFEPAFGEAWNRRQVMDALSMPNTHCLLAGPDGREPGLRETIAGFTMSRGVLDEEELLLIAVRPQMRGQGIGAVLMARFVNAAKSRGATKFYLEMRDGNPAIHLYGRFGFEQVGRRRNYYISGNAGPFDAITFSRSDIKTV